MSENETMLFNLISEHKNTEEALAAAIATILSFLNHPEASAAESSVAYPEFA